MSALALCTVQLCRHTDISTCRGSCCIRAGMSHYFSLTIATGGVACASPRPMAALRHCAWKNMAGHARRNLHGRGLPGSGTRYPLQRLRCSTTATYHLCRVERQHAHGGTA